MHNSESAVPTILCSGFYSYGPNSLLCRTPMGHQWGGFLCGDLASKMREEGCLVLEGDVSPTSSNWDRACEMYACIKGGRVDYGAQHAKKFGHARYGREYPGLYTEWDTAHPVDLWGHSMGAPEIRILTSLLCYGCPEEMQADSPSPLFAGGSGKMVRSVTTFAGANNGTSIADLAYYALAKSTGSERRGKKVLSAILGGLDLVFSRKPLNAIMDTYVSAWSGLDRCRTEDLGFYDLTAEGAKKINERYPDCPDTYYFAYPTSTTRRAKCGSVQVPQRETLIYGIPALIMGSYTDSHVRAAGRNRVRKMTA